MLAASSAVVAPIPAHQLLVFLLQLSLLLGVARLFGATAGRFGMPSVLGELLAGVALGPSLLGAVGGAPAGWLIPRSATQFHLLDAVGQLGVVLLVGLTGIDVDTRFLRRKVSATIPVSVAGLIVPFALGTAAGFVLPGDLIPTHVHRSTFALFLGVALAVSAIPVIAKILIDMKLVHREIGQLILAAATVDDVVGWLLLSVVAALATTGAHPGAIAATAGWVIVTGVAATVLGRPVAGVVLRFARRHGGPTGPLAAVAVMILAAGAATQAMRLEAILGAFAVGVALGSRDDLRPAELAPLRTVVLGVLAPLFFATAGLRVDLTQLRHPAVVGAAALVLVLAVAGKVTGAYAGARLGRLDHWSGLALGAGLNARGVIQLVVATVGVQLGVLTSAMYTVIVLVAIVTSTMAAPTLRWAMNHRDRVIHEAPREPVAWTDPALLDQ
jgi:Kef-type K+ transport system membrane component KefB